VKWNWPRWFSRSPGTNGAERLRRFRESILSARIVAIVILVVFIPSILITVLGIIGVYRAEPILRQWIEYPMQSQLSELDQRLIKAWDQRLRYYGQRLGAEERLHQCLLDLAEHDERIDDVIVFEAGEFRRIDPESPFWRLEAPLDHPGLAAASKLEFQEKDAAAALAAFEQLLEDAAMDLEVEALLGKSRACIALGKVREAVDALDRVIEHHGLSEDGSGLPRGLPALWRLVRLFLDQRDLVSAAVQARRLARFLEEVGPWLDDETTQRYRELLESYRRETNDFSLAVQPREVRRPLSTLTLNERSRAALVAHAKAVGSGPPSGYFRLETEGRPAEVLAYFHNPHLDRVVYLKLDAGAFLEDARLFTTALRIPDALLRFDVEAGAARGSGDAGARALIVRPFPPPFESHSMSYLPAPEQVPRHLESLETLKGTGVVWGLVVLVLTILLGVMITLRSILQEMQVARLKSDFVSFVTHELKTPLTAIRMITETLLLGRSGGPEDERKCIEIVDKEASRLSRLIEQILEFSRIEKKQQVFHFTSGDMSEVVDEAVRVFRDQCHDRSLEIEVHQAQKMSRIRMDRAAMVELLLNLLSNAYKYSRGPEKRIVINLKESIDDIFVEVVDFGIGIPKREQKRIFEKFYRAQDFLTRDIEGTGLGLTFARYIANVHDGEIKVSSVVNQGSTFTLELRKNQILAE
jgi:signal transduction histidine kinase